MEIRQYATKLSRDMAIGERFCIVENTTQFPDEGHLAIGGEQVSYTNKMSGSFNEIIRGLRGTIQKAHKKGTPVVLISDFNPISDLYNKVLSRLGDDIYLGPDGDIFVTGGGDIRMASGIETLDIRLRIRVNSALGIGINNEVGVAPDLGVTDERVLVNNVASAVSIDPDVEKVENISARRDGDTLYVTMDVYVRGMTEPTRFVYKIVTNLS